MSFSGFSPSLFAFLEELDKNNNREWFARNKSRYEEQVLNPSLAFIEAFAKPLAGISPMFHAIAKKSGGSVMRVYRDTRFSKDKSPYKTFVGIHFRHEFGRDIHAPGFYVHLDPQESFVGAGIWHPDNPTLRRIRTRIMEEPALWRSAVYRTPFSRLLELAGDSLKRAPVGVDPLHPLIEDLKRKDFIGVRKFSNQPPGINEIEAAFRGSRKMMQFLCEAIGLPF